MLPCHLILIVGVLYRTLLCATTISAVTDEAVTDPANAVPSFESTPQEPPLTIPAGAANYYYDPLASSSAEPTAANHVPTTVPTETAAVESTKSATVEVGTLVNTYDTKQTVVETNDETRIYLHDPTSIQPGMELWNVHLNSADATKIHDGASFGSFPTVVPVEVISEGPPASMSAEEVLEQSTFAVGKVIAQEPPVVTAEAAYYLEPLASFPVESTATNPVPAIVQTETVAVELADAAIGEASVFAISTRIGEENVTASPTVEVVGTLNINNKTQTVTVVEMNDETRIYLYDPTFVQPGIEPWTTHLNSARRTSIGGEPSIPFPKIVPVETISEEPPAASIPVEAVIELPIVTVPVEVTAKEPSMVIPAEAISVEVPMESSPAEPTATDSVPVAEPVEATIVDESVTVQPAVKAGTVDISFNKKPTVTVVETNDETRIYVYDSSSIQPGMEPWKTKISWSVATIYGSYPVMVPTVAPVAVLSEEPSPATIPTDSTATVAAVSAEAASVEPDDIKDATDITRTDEVIKCSLQATLETRTANKKKHTVKVIEKDDQTIIFVYDPKSIQPGMEPWRTF